MKKRRRDISPLSSMKIILITVSFIVFCNSLSAQHNSIIKKHILDSHATSLNNVYVVLNKKGQEAWASGNYLEAMIAFRKMLKLSQLFDNKKAKATALHNIGFIYTEFNNFHKSILYFKKALWIRKSINDTLGIASSENNIAQQYMQLDSLNIAKKYYENALILSRIISDSLLEGNVLNNLGNLYLRNNETSNAQNCYTASLAIRKKTDDLRGIIESYKNFAKLNIKLESYAEAEKYINQGLLLAKESENYKQTKHFYFLEYNLSLKTRNYASALEKYILYKNLEDSLNSAENEFAINQLELQYQTREKELQIKELLFNDILKETEIQQQKLFLIIFLSVSVLLLILSVIISKMYLQKRKAYNTLMLYNIEAVTRDLNENKERGTNSFSEEKKSNLHHKIIHCIEKEKAYLNPGFSIEDLAEKTNSNRQYISTVINEMHKKNFNTFINEYRIKEARKLLIDDKNNIYTIETISEMVGFQSRNSFISAFKKFTGVTPSYFKANKDRYL